MPSRCFRDSTPPECRPPIESQERRSATNYSPLPKGSRTYRTAGNMFFVSMLMMSGSGAYRAAFIKPNMGNVFGGVLTFYFVASGWLAVLRKEGENRPFGIWRDASCLAQGVGGLNC